MQTKNLNTFRITHFNGSVEEISAVDMAQALANTGIAETTSPVVSAVRTKTNVKTLVDDAPTVVYFTASVATGGGGSIATPASGTVHVGDSLTLKAIPARNYTFVNWKMNGEIISTAEEFLYTIPELADGEESAVFTAEFKLSDVSYTATVSPAGASGAGCLAFPASGTVQANSSLGLIAVGATGYTFSHWERNGASISTNVQLATTVEPLAEGESSAVYTAVFTE